MLIILLVYNKLTNYSITLKLKWNFKLLTKTKITELYNISAELNFHVYDVRYDMFYIKMKIL